MVYENITEGVFLDRPNRFIAKVLLNGNVETVHVKNTGRCKELLIKGNRVFLEGSKNPNRKTKFSLISVYKNNNLINLDSQCPNQVVSEALFASKIPDVNNITFQKREVSFFSSRFDIYFETKEYKGVIEVKGVTLENSGVAMFPDAPTVRGTKHVNELISLKREGYETYIFFLIQMKGVHIFKPNVETDPNFSSALLSAKKAGVNILAYDSVVTENSIELGSCVDIFLKEV